MKSREAEGMWSSRIDCLKRAGMRAKGMERKCVTFGVDGELERPMRGPSRGWVNVWGLGWDIVKLGGSWWWVAVDSGLRRCKLSEPVTETAIVELSLFGC